MVDFGRLLTAMVTPFDEQGKIDWKKAEKLIDHLLETGTDTLVVSGTTGESPVLSKEEKIELFRFVTAYTAGRAKVIAGTGSNDTYSSIALTKEAEKTGVHGIMLVAPYYNKPNQEGLYQHFKAIAESTTLPVMIYNVPGRTAVNIAVDTIVRLAQIPNVFAVKEASGDLSQMAYIIEKTPADFILYSGDDKVTLPVLAIGGKGVVSVASHVIGREMKEMMELFNAGQLEEAAKLHRKLLPVFEGLFFAPSPVPVKTALNMKGVDVGPMRLPLVPLNEREEEFLRTLLSGI